MVSQRSESMRQFPPLPHTHYGVAVRSAALLIVSIYTLLCQSTLPVVFGET